MNTRLAATALSLLLSTGALPALAQQPASPPAPSAAPAPAPQPDAADARSAALDARIGALFSPRAGLTADEVASRAAASSFDVRARHAELEAASAAVDQAIVGYFPRLALTGRYLKLSPLPDADLGHLLAISPSAPLGPVAAGTPIANVPLTLPALSNMTILHANLTVPFSDYVLRIPEAHAAASRSAKAAELNETAARRKAALDGRVAYYGWVRARLQAFVAHQALDQARGHLADVRHQFEAGATSKADVLRVEAQVASSELLVQRAEGLARTSEESVRIAMHDPDPGRAYALGEDVRAGLPALGTPRDLQKLYAESLEKRPEIRALDETAWSLKELGRVARATAYPRFDGLAQVSYDNPEQRVFPPTQDFKAGWAVGGQITWTLNDIGVGVTQGKQVDAHRAQIEAQKGQLTDALRTEVSQAEQAMEDAEVAIETGARGLAAAEESYRVRRSLFQNGRAISVELSDAETELTRASLDLVNARVELRVARARLLHALGRDGERPSAVKSGLTRSAPKDGRVPGLVIRSAAMAGRQETLFLGAVAYDPKVVTIWDGFTRFFAEHELAFDYVLYTNYERQVEGQLRGEHDVAWSSPLAWIETERLAQARSRSARAVAMRDTDQGLTSVIVVRADSAVRSLDDLRGRRVAVGALDSPQATLLPLLHLAEHGLEPHRDFEVVPHDVLVGKHGDHIGGEREAAKALLAGTVDAACLLDANLLGFARDGTLPEGRTRVVAQTAPYDHCNFTVLDGAPEALVTRFTELLLGMSYDDPAVRPLMDLEGLKAWRPGRTEGYAALSRACDRFGTIAAWLAAQT